MHVQTLGIDLAKTVFQLHGVDADGKIVVRKALCRSALLRFLEELDPCLIGMEACPSAHYWARTIAALGHEVRLMPPAYVKPYVKRQKNDAADAEAICEAVTRPNMRFVPIKTDDQQAVLMMHRSRDLLVRQRTRLFNAMRGHLAEFGIAVAAGFRPLLRRIEEIREAGADGLPDLARAILTGLADQVAALNREIRTIERSLLAWHRQSPASQRLKTIPGIGIFTATAIAASVPDPRLFTSGRQFAAWIGLTPKQHSSGGKERLGRISKMGNRHLRRLLITGATSVLRRVKAYQTGTGQWVRGLCARKPARLVTVAMANKTARIAWAVLMREEDYRPPAMTAA